MNQPETFEAKKAELFELIKRESGALANRDGLTPLQSRLVICRSLSSHENEEEEKLCAELCEAVALLDEVQVDRFVKYVLRCKFKGDHLRFRYNRAYIQKLKASATPLSPVVFGLLTAMVLNLGEVKLSEGELLNDPTFTQIKFADSDLWLELLYHTSWDLFEEELVENFDTYGYEVLSLGRDRWLDEGRCDLDRLSNLVLRLSDKLKANEIKWMQDFLTQQKT